MRKALHCAFSFQLALTFNNDFKLVYTGDTRPTEDLIELGQSGGKATDLLIHEATAEHAMLADIQMKKHSTFTEAIEDGQKMGAGFTLLTHFSQRYSKSPLLDEIEGKERVGVAWDHMTVTPATWATIPKVYPLLKAVFTEEFELMQDKSEDYLVKNENETLVSKVKKRKFSRLLTSDLGDK